MINPAKMINLETRMEILPESFDYSKLIKERFKRIYIIAIFMTIFIAVSSGVIIAIITCFFQIWYEFYRTNKSLRFFLKSISHDGELMIIEYYDKSELIVLSGQVMQFDITSEISINKMLIVRKDGKIVFKQLVNVRITSKQMDDVAKFVILAKGLKYYD